MENSDRFERYNGVAQSLHWLTVILFLLAVTFALLLPEEPESPAEYLEYSAHQTLGVLIFVVTVLRLLWRSVSQVPALPASIPGWQRLLARTVQYLLYATLIAQPVIGVLMVWTEGGSVTLFGSLTVPSLISANEAISEITDELHEIIGWSMIVLAAIHAAAGLMHHFILRDEVLRSMLPGRLR